MEVVLQMSFDGNLWTILVVPIRLQCMCIVRVVYSSQNVLDFMANDFFINVYVYRRIGHVICKGL